MKNNTETTNLHSVVSNRLQQARDKLEKLKVSQREIDLQIEDYSRIVLSLERTEATLAVALDPPVVPTPELTDGAKEAVNIALGNDDEDARIDAALGKINLEAAE